MCTLFQAKLIKTQTNCVDFPTVLCEPLLALHVAMSDAIGCPLEFIVFPLLTFSAACMGVNAHVAINEMWKEPTILWLIVASNKRQKKTAALRLLKKPLEQIECMEAENWRRQQKQLATTTTDSPPQLCIDNFSFEELHHVMKRNRSQILGLFDEMSTMYSPPDLYKQSGSVIDRKTLIALNGGSSWSRNY